MGQFAELVGGLRFAQVDTLKTNAKTKTKQVQEQLPHPPPNEGGRMGHPMLFLDEPKDWLVRG